MLAGGDSCSRAILAGFLLGLKHGFDDNKGVPSAWLEKTEVAEECLKLALELVNM